MGARASRSIGRRRQPALADGSPTDDLLRATAVVVRYGPTIALDRIDLDLRRGEIHAVIGENGAGKSTLLRVLAGSL